MPQLQSPEIQAFANGFPIALMHIAVTVAILFIGVTVYVLMTPHREIALIREGNSAAALSLGGVLVGLAIPLSAGVTVAGDAVTVGECALAAEPAAIDLAGGALCLLAQPCERRD